MPAYVPATERLETASLKGMSKVLLASVAMLGITCGAWAQDAGNPPTPPDNTPPPSGNARSVSWPELIPNILSDQKQIWSFPAHLNQRRKWVPALAVVAVTAALVATDPWTDKPFQTTTAFHGFNSVFSSTNASAAMIALPAAWYGIGFLAKDSYATETALFVGEAVANSEIVATVIKTATRRERPLYFGGSNVSDSWFEGPGGVGLGHGGFPSGHTIAAFSIATVMSRRYGKTHRWVPYLAYGLAATVGFSRVTTLAHFPSDVFLGAALGYSISRFSVLHQ